MGNGEALTRAFQLNVMNHVAREIVDIAERGSWLFGTWCVCAMGLRIGDSWTP